MKKLITQFTLLVLTAGCVLNCDSKRENNQGLDAVTYDTSKFAAILFDTTTLSQFMGFRSKQSQLNQKDFPVIDSLFAIGIKEYNHSLDLTDSLLGNRSIKFTPLSYWKQLVVVTNDKGEKIVWVSCFCQKPSENWKKDLTIVMDGGNCYLNFKVNLSTKKYFDFLVNEGA